MPWCENLLKEPVETCACFCKYVAKAEREARGEYVGAEPEREKEGVQAPVLHMFGCIHACVVWKKNTRHKKAFLVMCI